MDKRAFWIGMWLAAGLAALGGPTNQPAERSCLGMTVDQCDQHYGTPVSIGENPNPMEIWVPTTIRSYKRDGMSIDVAFVDGNAVRIEYYAPSDILDAEKLQGLMDVNKQGRTWSLQVKDTDLAPSIVREYYYSSRGGRIVVWFYNDAPKNTDLQVCSPEAFTPAYIKKNNAKFREHSKAGTKDSL